MSFHVMSKIRRPNLSAISLSLAVLLSLAAPALAVDDPAARSAIARLLEVGWAATPQAHTAADAQYDQLMQLAPGDRSALTASLLVLMQQRRFDDAYRRVNEILTKDPTDITALRARVWLATILKNYPSTLITTEKLSEQVAAMPVANEDERLAQEELISFLGRIFGFLGGPAADSVNQEQRKIYEKQVFARLDETRKLLFVEARDGVLQKYIEMTDTTLDERDKAALAAEAAKEKTLQELEDEKAQMAQRVKELDESRTKFQSELKDELADIRKLDAPLVQELAGLQARAGTLRRDLFSYEADISRLLAAASAEKDPNRRFQLQSEADRLSQFAGRIEADLFGVNRQGSAVQSQRAALAARQQRAQATASSQAQRIDKELADLGRRGKRNDGIEKRTSRATTVSTSRVRSLSAQATALGTYDQFPLEQAKERLMESLR